MKNYIFISPTVRKKHINTFIGAQAYFKNDKLPEALEDASKSVELNPGYFKANFKKAKIERELLLNEESLKSSEKALELNPEDEDAIKLYEEWKQEWDDDHTVDEENPHKKRFNHLEQWLKDGGSKYDKLKIRFYNPIYRGVHAARKIRVRIHKVFVIGWYTQLMLL